MNYTVEQTNKFRKSFKKCLKRGLDPELFKTVVRLLASTGTLPIQYRPHKLVNDYAGCWECHISSDWLLIWQQNDTTLTLLMVDTGTHSDLFG